MRKISLSSVRSADIRSELSRRVAVDRKALPLGLGLGDVETGDEARIIGDKVELWLRPSYAIDGTVVSDETGEYPDSGWSQKKMRSVWEKCTDKPMGEKFHAGGDGEGFLASWGGSVPLKLWKTLSLKGEEENGEGALEVKKGSVNYWYQDMYEDLEKAGFEAQGYSSSQT